MHGQDSVTKKVTCKAGLILKTLGVDGAYVALAIC